jgi:hypothetical protein
LHLQAGSPDHGTSSESEVDLRRALSKAAYCSTRVSALEQDLRVHSSGSFRSRRRFVGTLLQSQSCDTSPLAPVVATGLIPSAVRGIYLIAIMAKERENAEIP